jgi:hypothetical protein
MIWKLFGSKKPATPMRDVRALSQGLATPAIHMVKTIPRASSCIGGAPALPPGIPWPVKEGQKLDFIAQLDLVAVHAAAPVDWLPRTGALLFFYDIEKSPWGYDPKDRGRWAVVHVPEVPPVPPADSSMSDGEAALLRAYVAFKKIESYPSWEHEPVAAL